MDELLRMLYSTPGGLALLGLLAIIVLSVVGLGALRLVAAGRRGYADAQETAGE